MKKDQYFNLEVNLLNDDNIAGMMSELDAAEALGIYVMLLLHLRTKDNYEASCTPLLLRAFARRHDLELDMLEKVLHDYNLFEVDEERQTFRAPYLDRVMQRLEEKWRMDTENGKKGGRPKKRAKCAETPATKGRKPNETQERREEEKIGITPVVNNSSNTLAGGAADAAMVVA
ncbi:Lin1244/Lin1753 domain-containing protein, partial [Bacteroides finegoldii]